jgi:hypothetical protein
VQEFDPPTALVMAGFDQTGGHLQGRKQGCRAMTFRSFALPSRAGAKHSWRSW